MLPDEEQFEVCFRGASKHHARFKIIYVDIFKRIDTLTVHDDVLDILEKNEEEDPFGVER